MGVADAELMQRLARGQMSALAEIVHRHQDSIRSIAFRMTGRWDVADDIAQEAFLRVHRSAGSYRPSAAFRTWLYRIVVNLCLDRAKSPRPATLPADERGIPDAIATPPDQLIRQERVNLLRAAIGQLPERQQMALVLHRFDGLSYAQISQTTGWSESAVESLLVRAYDQLRQRLREQMASHE